MTIISNNKIIDGYHEHIASRQDHHHDSDNDANDSDLDDQDFLDLLEDDNDAATQRYREQRTQQLAQQMAAARANAARATVETLESESALFALTTSYAAPLNSGNRGSNNNNNYSNSSKNARNQHAYVVVHFFQPKFTTCERMDAALTRLARAHFGEVTFARLDVANAPFLAVKLDLRVLPCVLVLSAATGREVKRLQGFDELGNDPNDGETVFRRFEQVLFQARVISRVTYGGGAKKSVLGFGQSSSSSNSSSIKASRNRRDESDDDWD